MNWKRLLSAQAEHYPAHLTPDFRAKLIEEVFWEEEQKPQEVGKCRYGVKDSNGEVEPRLARGSDLFQEKRIYEEVNNFYASFPASVEMKANWNWSNAIRLPQCF